MIQKVTAACLGVPLEREEKTSRILHHSSTVGKAEGVKQLVVVTARQKLTQLFSVRLQNAAYTTTIHGDDVHHRPACQRYRLNIVCFTVDICVHIMRGS